MILVILLSCSIVPLPYLFRGPTPVFEKVQSLNSTPFNSLSFTDLTWTALEKVIDNRWNYNLGKRIAILRESESLTFIERQSSLICVKLMSRICGGFHVSSCLREQQGTLKFWKEASKHSNSPYNLIFPGNFIRKVKREWGVGVHHAVHAFEWCKELLTKL